MGKPEAEIEDYLVKQCKANNILCWKFTSPSQNGVPDRILIHNKIVFVETKRRNGQLRLLQERICQQMSHYGATVFTANCEQDVDNIISFMLTP